MSRRTVSVDSSCQSLGGHHDYAGGCPVEPSGVWRRSPPSEQSMAGPLVVQCDACGMTITVDRLAKTVERQEAEEDQREELF